jgi:hypothetical protein
LGVEHSPDPLQKNGKYSWNVTFDERSSIRVENKLLDKFLACFEMIKN